MLNFDRLPGIRDYMGWRSTFIRRIDAIVTTSGILGIIFLPGVVMHELGHVTICRLLSVEVTETRLAHRPQDVLRPYRIPNVRTVYQEDEPLKAIVVAVGPMLSNTVGALAVFALVRYVLPIGFLGVPSDLAGLFSIYLLRTPFTVTSIEYFFGLFSLWVGVTMALTAVPSKEDGRLALTLAARTDGVRYYVAFVIATAVYLLGTPWIGLDFVYGVALTAFGLVGVEFALVIWREYLFFIGISFLLAVVTEGPKVGPVLYRRWNHPNYSLFELEARVIGRIDRVQQLAEAEESITDHAIAFLVDQLDRPSERVRVRAAESLHSVAEAEPERLSKWEESIIDRWYVEPSPEARFHLLGVLIEAEAMTSSRENFRDVAIEAMADESVSVSSQGTALVGYLSAHDPSLFFDHIETFVEALDHPKENAQRNIATALSVLAEASPLSIEPFADELHPYRNGPDEIVAEKIAEALDHLDTVNE